MKAERVDCFCQILTVFLLLGGAIIVSNYPLDFRSFHNDRMSILRRVAGQDDSTSLPRVQGGGSPITRDILSKQASGRQVFPHFPISSCRITQRPDRQVDRTISSWDDNPQSLWPQQLLRRSPQRLEHNQFRSESLPRTLI